MSQDPPIRIRPWLWGASLAGVVLVVALLILFPSVASAYQVERAGRMLDSDPASEEARARLLRAVDQNPHNAQAFRFLAQVDAERGDWSSAADNWAHFVRLRPSDPEGYWYLAAACEQLAASDRKGSMGPCARSSVELWKSAGQTASDFVRAGDALGKQALWEEAAAYYNRALLLDPRSAAAWNGLGDAYRLLLRHDAALAAYAQAAELSPVPAPKAAAHAARAELLAAQGLWQQASAEMELAVSLAPTEGGYRLNYGWYLLQANGDPEVARAELLEAAHLLPANPWPHVHLAVLAFAGMEYHTAVEEAQAATALDQKLFWAWLWLGKALDGLGRSAEAEHSLRRAVDLASERAEPHAELGAFLQSNLRVGEAIPHLEKAVHLAPNNLAHRFRLAAAYRTDGRAEDAARVYQEILVMDPGNQAAEQSLANLKPNP